AVAIWLLVFSKPEPPSPLAGVPLPMTPEDTLDLFNRIKKQLQEILKRYNHAPSVCAVLAVSNHDHDGGP
ncbi:MAG TPA: hypothetical protein VG649_01305, partial [Candidatus Angelobacter sp.]|nr:hypothetical protein [Candidatus Angelobacter sp.]